MSRQAPLAFIVVLALAGCLPQPSTAVNVADLVATSVGATLAAQAPAPPATQPQVTVDTPVATSPPSATEPPTLPPSTATTTPSATAPATNTSTPIAGDPRSALGQPTWRDTFSSATGWNLGGDSFTRAEIDDGQFVLTGLSTADGWRLTWPEIETAYLEATIRTGTCQGSDEYGLIFRVPDIHEPNEGYLFGFTCDGRYFLRTWDGEQMNSLVSATTASAIQAGGEKTNRIGVWAEDDELSLYANGTFLVELQDDTFPDEGGFGFFVGARQTVEFTIRSDEIAYWDLP
ncbi:MAG TPA: hypothetical protein VI701_02190 [Anaerolineales bacterium]|nr:hypothetical protein [Anaerolineales bacterium]